MVIFIVKIVLRPLRILITANSAFMRTYILRDSKQTPVVFDNFIMSFRSNIIIFNEKMVFKLFFRTIYTHACIWNFFFLFRP